MRKTALLALILLALTLTACDTGGRESGSISETTSASESSESTDISESTGASESAGQPDAADGTIQALVSKNCNYIYHMLSVAQCGYDNDYGRRYRPLHPQADLQALKRNEELLTVAGGKHTGELYQLCVSLPASLDDSVSVPEYFDALADLFSTDDLEQNFETYREIYEQTFTTMGATVDLEAQKAFYDNNELLKAEIAEIAQVMRDNFAIYSDEVWETSQAELSAGAEELNQAFRAAGYERQWETLLGRAYGPEHFYAVLCNSLQDGPGCIDISADKDVFYLAAGDASMAQMISHEFGIYLLREELRDTDAFEGFADYPLVEGLAEYYNRTMSDGHPSWDWTQPYIAFYQQQIDSEPGLFPKDLFLRAKEHFASDESESGTGAQPAPSAQ